MFTIPLSGAKINGLKFHSVKKSLVNREILSTKTFPGELVGRGASKATFRFFTIRFLRCI